MGRLPVNQGTDIVPLHTLPLNDGHQSRKWRVGGGGGYYE